LLTVKINATAHTKSQKRKKELFAMAKSRLQWVLLSLGACLDALGFYFFLAPNQIAAGGITGASLVLHHLWPQIPLGALVSGFSVCLLLLGFGLVGPVFGVKTVYCSLVIPAVIWLAGEKAPLTGPRLDDTLLQLFFGVLISGAGLALMFNQNASSGGTDILARILKKYYHINMGQGLFLIDFFITLGAGWVFGLGPGLYSLLGVILYTFVVDYLLDGLSTSKQITVFTRHSDTVRRYVICRLQRGVTIYRAQGGFTGMEQAVVVTVLKRGEFIKLKAFVRQVDPQAFITVQKIHEVFGEGFAPAE
jgi:uncharacterized membrane-anchored protein YitT (DUF2179 family)